MMKDSVRGGGISSNIIGRESNIELFRIIVMIFIVAHHYVVNSGLIAADGGGPIYSDPLSFRSLFLLIFGAWGKTGINCFVLITGYFMCESQITVRKFLKLLFEIMFYRILILGIFWITGYEQYSFLSFIWEIMPVKTVSDGFYSCFLVFYCCIPYLNILIHHINERQHIYLLLLCGFTYVFMGTVPFFGVSMNYVSWFIVIYFIASYIRRYPKKIYQKQMVWGMILLFLMLLSAVSVIICAWIGVQIDREMAYYFVTDSNTFLAVAVAVSAFIFFKSLRISHNEIINRIAQSTFGVLCIHAFNDTMRRWLWGDIFDNVGHYDVSYMPIYAVGVVIIVYIVCTVIDQLRIIFVEKPFIIYCGKHVKNI